MEFLKALLESQEDKYVKWQEQVKKKYPGKKFSFKGKSEGGKHLISAEVSGEDRCYGVWDLDTETGEVLGD